MMRRKPIMGEEFSADLQWETLASLWFSEFGTPIDLHTAASIGDVDAVKQWIARGVDPNALNSGGWTALMYAAYLGHAEVCSVLLRSGNTDHVLLIDARSRDQLQTALMLASSCGNENIVSLLLKHNASVDVVDSKNRCALHYATECNHAQVVRQLLLAGANPNLLAELNGQYVEGYMTPFHLACAEGLDVIVQYFLQCGAAEKNTVFDGARSLALKNGHTKIVMMIDNHGKHGGVGLKCDDHAPLRKKSSLLDGPNAISSLMKLQCNLASNDSNYRPQRNDLQHRSANEHIRGEDCERTQAAAEQRRRPQTIEEFLEILQLTKYLPVFRENNIDLERLLVLNGDELEAVGIKLFGPRKKILNAIDRWHQNVSLTRISDCQLQTELHQSDQSLVDDYEKTLTVDQYPRPKTIEEFLDVLQLTKYLPVFVEHNVDLDKLLTLTGDELKDIGIKLFGPRKKILNAIERWHQNIPLTGIF